MEVYTAAGREVRILSAEDLSSLRMKVDFFLLDQDRLLLLNQEGRDTRLLSQLPLSLGWYGRAAVAIIKPERTSTAGGVRISASAGR